MTGSEKDALPLQSKRTIFNLSIGYLGLQVTFGIESASLSRIYQGFGASVEDLALLWLAGPVAGLIVQPLIGALSDRSWTRFGRRRPYMFGAALVAIYAILQLAFAPNLTTAIAMVWLLEFAMNALNAPYRALVGDTLPASQQGEGFAMQTAFIGLGAFLGALAPKLLSLAGLSNVSMGDSAAMSIKIGFVIAAICLAISVGWTLFAVNEYDRGDFRRFEVANIQHSRMVTDPSRWLDQAATTLWSYRWIAIIQSFAWAGLYLLWVYATPAVAKQAFGAVRPQSPAFADGADWVGVMFAAYNGVAGLFAFILPKLFDRLGVRLTHSVALAIGACGLTGVAVVNSPWALLVCATMIGASYASTLSAPFVMASRIARKGAAGLSIGIMNIFIVLPQLAMGLLMGRIMMLVSPNDPSAAFFWSGGFTLVAAVICLVHPSRATIEATN